MWLSGPDFEIKNGGCPAFSSSCAVWAKRLKIASSSAWWILKHSISGKKTSLQLFFLFFARKKSWDLEGFWCLVLMPYRPQAFRVPSSCSWTALFFCSWATLTSSPTRHGCLGHWKGWIDSALFQHFNHTGIHSTTSPFLTFLRISICENWKHLKTLPATKITQRECSYLGLSILLHLCLHRLGPHLISFDLQVGSFFDALTRKPGGPRRRSRNPSKLNKERYSVSALPLYPSLVPSLWRPPPHTIQTRPSSHPPIPRSTAWICAFHFSASFSVSSALSSSCRALSAAFS